MMRQDITMDHLPELRTFRFRRYANLIQPGDGIEEQVIRAHSVVLEPEGGVSFVSLRVWDEELVPHKHHIFRDYIDVIEVETITTAVRVQ